MTKKKIQLDNTASRRTNIVEFILFPALMMVAFLFLRASGISEIPWMEFIPVMLTLIAMPMLKLKNPWGQILSFVGQVLFAFYFLALNLMGQVIFGVIWAALNLVGFYRWSRPGGNKKSGLVPTFLWPAWLAAILMGGLVVAWITSTGGVINVLDYAILYFGLTGQLILIKKKVDGWTLWIITTIAAIVLCWMMGLYLLLLRSFMYLFIYITAFIKWRREAINR